MGMRPNGGAVLSGASIRRGAVTRLAAGAIAAFALSAGTAADAAVYRVMANAKARMHLGHEGGDGPVRVMGKPKGGRWRPLPAVRADNGIDITVDPAEMGSSDILLVIDPPPGMDIDDATPPAIRQILLDGKPITPGPDIDLGTRAPRAVSLDFRDQQNDLVRGAIRVQLDGRALGPGRSRLTYPSAREVRVGIDLGEVALGRHTLAVIVPDSSPERNSASVTMTFERIDTTNLIRALGDGISVTVDSHYPGYPLLAPLTDGVTDASEVGAGNAGAWASAENESAHWIKVQLAEAKPVGKVTVYWPRPELASRNIRVEVLRADTWETVASSSTDDYQPRPSTTLTFPPVNTTSFRIVQPAGGGCMSRPSLFWVSEIQAR